MTVQAGLCRTLSNTQIVGFLASRLILVSGVSARSCSVAQVWCDDGKQSVSVFKWGDGVCDCLDGSDESQW